MALPEKVIEQIGRESDNTPGWAPGALVFSGGVLFLAIVIYIGLVFGYNKYLNNQLTATQAKVAAEGNLISPAQQTQLINFYSQISNLQTLLQNHVLPAQFFSWLENNTEANVYYQSFSLTSEDSVTFTALASTEADANQQIAIFESSENASEIQSVSVSNLTAPILGANGGWSFSVTLVMKPSVFLAPTTQ